MIKLNVMKPKRYFYNERDYQLDFDNQVLILKPELHNKLLTKTLWNKFGFKKIGGSSVGDVLETDSFKSQFAAFARMAWCGLPILDTKYVDAGIIIEPMVINVLKEATKKEIETFNPDDYNYDYFEGKDDIIGGIPDGYIPSDKIILEIKTTSEKNYQNWITFGVPSGYLKQAQIYCYLMGVEEYWIVATFLHDEDYVNPNNYPIRERRIKNFRFKINKSQVQDDINIIKSWYEKHTRTGISPKWDLKKDNDLLEFLMCKNEQEYESLLEKWIEEGKYVKR